MPSTEKLVNAAKAGERDAFAELVCRYEGTVLVTAWSVVGDFHAAQDVAQDAFVIAFRKLAQLRDERTFGPWLLSIVKREGVRAKRKQVRRSEIAFSCDTITVDEGWWNEFEDILPALEQLPDHERLVVSLRFIDGLSVREIADAIGRPVGTVTKQLSRAIKRLRGFITEVEK